MSYIELKIIGQSISGKTSIYEVINEASKVILGRIAWKGTWRKYCFFPKENTVFDYDCLKEIASFCLDMTYEHRNKNASSK